MSPVAHNAAVPAWMTGAVLPVVFKQALRVTLAIRFVARPDVLFVGFILFASLVSMRTSIFRCVIVIVLIPGLAILSIAFRVVSKPLASALTGAIAASIRQAVFSCLVPIKILCGE